MEILIVFLPLLAAIISGFFGNKLGSRFSEILTSFLVSISTILSIFVFYNVIINDYNSNIIISSWISSGTINIIIPRNSAPIKINKQEILIKSKIKKKTEWTVFFEAVTIIADTIAINENI